MNVADDERPFLDAILASPEDDEVRLVYADWLEERGDAERAEWLRLEVKLAGDATFMRRTKWARWSSLGDGIDLDWQATLSRIPVDNCTLRPAELCPRRWERLRATLDPRNRRCDKCGLNVTYHFRSPSPWPGDPVAVDPADRYRDELEFESTRFYRRRSQQR